MIKYILQGIGMGIGMGIVVVIYFIIELFCKYKIQRNSYKELTDYIKKSNTLANQKPKDMEFGDEKPDTKFNL